MGKVHEIELTTQSKEEVIDITPFIEQLIEKEALEEGFICVYVPHTSAAVTIHRKLADPVKPKLAELLEKVNPDEEAPHYTKAALVAPTEVLVVKEGRLGIGPNQRVYFYEFNGPKRRKVYIYIND